MYQIGDGTNTNRNLPTAVSTVDKFVNITADTGDHTCGLLQDGTAKCWGALQSGRPAVPCQCST